MSYIQFLILYHLQEVLQKENKHSLSIQQLHQLVSPSYTNFKYQINSLISSNILKYTNETKDFEQSNDMLKEVEFSIGSIQETFLLDKISKESKKPKEHVEIDDRFSETNVFNMIICYQVRTMKRSKEMSKSQIMMETVGRHTEKFQVIL